MDRSVAPMSVATSTGSRPSSVNVNRRRRRAPIRNTTLSRTAERPPMVIIEPATNVSQSESSAWETP